MEQLMKHIRVITPAVACDEFQPMVEHILAFQKPDLQISHVFLDKGPVSIETFVDDALTVPDTMIKAILAEKEGVDGILINCMCDPGLYAVRECVSIPVVATAEVAMHTAAILGHKFGFIDVLESSRTLVEDQVARYGVASKFACFRAVNIPVLEIEGQQEKVAGLLAAEGARAVIESHADILILGCGAFIGCDKAMEEILKSQGINVPVIDPLPLAIKYLIAITEIGLRHSKKAYPTPMPKAAPTGYSLPPYNKSKL
jgi:allantoin racemase